MSEVSLRFGGKLIEELSQKIPSTLFALNELIKNAYDAFSSDITIKVSPSKNSIVISDNGNGMGVDEVESLFHISKSSKRYGHVIVQDGLERITQGSKGLGFLAAFKFGDCVQWVTSKGGVQSTFSLRKSDLVSRDDLSGIKIPISTKASEGKGTIITISSSADEIKELLDDLASDRVSEKLAAAVIDKEFDIKVEVEGWGGGYSTRKLKDFKQESEGDQLFFVYFDSDENVIEFYHKGELLDSIPGLSEPLLRSGYSISLELVIFFFGPGRNSKFISSLNKRVYDDALYPLVYFNRNLFNNTSIFDPELLRKTSSGSSLPQMIGRVNLRSQSEDFEFNSDRTNFVENPLTKSLVKNLKALNEIIQSKGSELKRDLQKNSHRGKPPTGKAAPALRREIKRKAAFIALDGSISVEIDIPSDQIELSKYISKVGDSLGNEVDKSEVEITVDGEISNGRVLLSIEEPCEKRVRFRYQDSHTGLVSTEIILKFSKKISSVTGVPQSQSLFRIESESGYRLGQGMVSNLIYAIDKAYQTRNKEEYLPLIACSIRCIFDISWIKIFKSRKQWFGKINKNGLSPGLKKELNSELVFGVAYVLILLKKNQSLLREISESSGITFSTLNNILDVPAFGSAVKLSNVGAHSSSSYLSKPKIEECADKCGLFAVICDILINLDSVKVSSLDVVKVDVEDFEAYMGW